MFDEAWEELRWECHKFMKEKEEFVIKRWLSTMNYTRPVGYYMDRYNKTMEIFTTTPGILIGKAGVNIDEFKRMLSEEFHGEWKVKLIEVRGGFVNI